MGFTTKSIWYKRKAAAVKAQKQRGQESTEDKSNAEGEPGAGLGFHR